MATAVYTTEVIQLLDDTEIVLRPLAINPLKKFMESFAELNTDVTESEFIDQVLKLALICLKNNKAIKDRDDDLGDVIDLDSAYKIIEICGGIKLNDPKLAEAANQMMMENLEAGTD